MSLRGPTSKLLQPLNSVSLFTYPSFATSSQWPPQLCYLLTMAAHYTSHRMTSLPLFSPAQPERKPFLVRPAFSMCVCSILMNPLPSLGALAFKNKILSPSKALSAFHPATATTATETVLGSVRAGRR